MKFLMLVCWNGERLNAEEEPAADAAADAEGFPWLDDLQARGMWVTGDRLAPPRRAKSVRVREGKKLVTDGPVAETKEVVGGFDIIECGGVDEAVQIAAGHPVAEIGTIEVRPLWGNCHDRDRSAYCVDVSDVLQLMMNRRTVRRVAAHLPTFRRFNNGARWFSPEPVPGSVRRGD